VKVKRERDEDYSSIPSGVRPKKHPRRTLSEQIIVPSKLQESAVTPSSILSPRSPAPERVNRALTNRINHLKDENACLKISVTGLETEKTDLQQRMAKESHAYRGLQIESDALKKESEAMKREAEAMKAEMMAMKERLASVEASSERLRVEVEKLTAVEETSKELRKELRNEVEGLRGRVERSEKEAESAKEELLNVRRGLTKELGEAVKKWGT
jgi:predicted  nucleic acid-binding Zn-ribbon protein